MDGVALPYPALAITKRQMCYSRGVAGTEACTAIRSKLQSVDPVKCLIEI